MTPSTTVRLFLPNAAPQLPSRGSGGAGPGLGDMVPPDHPDHSSQLRRQQLARGRVCVGVGEQERHVRTAVQAEMRRIGECERER